MAQSFYGGKQGNSFKLVKQYSSVSQMNASLPTDTEIEYGAYVYVSSPDLPNSINNTIYQKTITGGAKKIGQIFPPTQDATHEVVQQGILNFNILDYDIVKNHEGSIERTYSLSNSGLLSGEDATEIKWVTCNLKNDTTEAIETVEIGFQIPIPIFNFSAIIDPNFNGTNILVREDDRTKPFFYNYSLHLPPLSGTTFNNLRYCSIEFLTNNFPSEGIYDTRVSPHIYYSNVNDFINSFATFKGKLILYDAYDQNSIKSVYILGEYKTITNINLSDVGTLSIQYNDSDIENLGTQLKWISEIGLGEDGTLIVTYNDTTTQTFSKVLKTITDITLSRSGNLTIQYNTIEEPVILGNIPRIKNINIDIGENEGEGTQKIQIEYFGETENDDIITPIGAPINYIMRLAINDQYHLLVLYSDPEKRANIINPATYDGRDDWLDLGSIKTYSGILIGKYVSNLDNYAIDTVINYLNTYYSTGLLGEDAGKIVVAGDIYATKDYYAFDYEQNKWFFLGTQNGNSSNGSNIYISDIEPTIELVPINGYWFKTIEV